LKAYIGSRDINKAGRSVRATILKEILVKLQETYFIEEENKDV
jgi:hypothetical protein